jgi:hypothetical protein
MGTGFGLVVGIPTGNPELRQYSYGYIIQFQITVYNLDILRARLDVLCIKSWVAGGGGRMKADAFRKFYWGFLFVMIDFRLMGIDVLPDIIGYIHFGGGLALLAAESEHFARAKNINLLLMLLSVLQIYERPAQESGVYIGSSGSLAFAVGIAVLIMGLLHVHDLFMGIKEMAIKSGDSDIAQEADSRWSQYLTLQIAGFLGLIVIALPVIGVLYLIGILAVTVVLAINIMNYMKRCEEILG